MLATTIQYDKGFSYLPILTQRHIMGSKPGDKLIWTPVARPLALGKKRGKK